MANKHHKCLLEVIQAENQHSQKIKADELAFKDTEIINLKKKIKEFESNAEMITKSNSEVHVHF